nr:hypothetical protein CFP56_20522 [Quercus suber]
MTQRKGSLAVGSENDVKGKKEGQDDEADRPTVARFCERVDRFENSVGRMQTARRRRRNHPGRKNMLARREFRATAAMPPCNSRGLITWSGSIRDAHTVSGCPEPRELPTAHSSISAAASYGDGASRFRSGSTPGSEGKRALQWKRRGTHDVRSSFRVAPPWRSRKIMRPIWSPVMKRAIHVGKTVVGRKGSYRLTELLHEVDGLPTVLKAEVLHGRVVFKTVHQGRDESIHGSIREYNTYQRPNIAAPQHIRTIYDTLGDLHELTKEGSVDSPGLVLECFDTTLQDLSPGKHENNLALLYAIVHAVLSSSALLNTQGLINTDSLWKSEISGPVRHCAGDCEHRADPTGRSMMTARLTTLKNVLKLNLDIDAWFRKHLEVQ